MANGIHSGQPLLTAGTALAEATTAMIMIHGRGATAASILELASEFKRPDLAYLAPQAAFNRWYPHSFMAPLEQNEPDLSAALALLGSLLARVEAAGLPPERTLLLGFSQGACLALEFAARNPRRYGGLIGLSGGLIGPPGIALDYPGSLAGTAVFLGCSDVDPHIPRQRVAETAEALRQMDADVTVRIYPGMGHTVNHDEMKAIRRMLPETG
jgi:phospholipase/carboxylesterase